MPNTYRPDHFRDIGESDLGRQLWLFLNEPENVLRMVTASELERPALEAVAPYLEEAFGPDAVARDRVKQTIGHMIRQILEEHGLQVDAQGLRVRSGTVFSKATRYRLTAAELLEKLKTDLASIRGKAVGADRSIVDGDLKAVRDLWAGARLAHPHLKKRLETVLNTHARLAPTLRVRMLEAP